MTNKIILHGSTYGQNFGDVLIQAILLKKIESRYLCEVSLPLAGRGFLFDIGRQRNLSKFLSARTLIFGPGGYFGQPQIDVKKWRGRFFKYHLLMVVASILFNKRIYVYGVGCGPIDNKLIKFFLKLVFNKSNISSVRDLESVLFLNKLGVTKTIDINIDIGILASHLYKIQEKRNLLKPIVVGMHFPDISVDPYVRDAFANNMPWLLKFLEDQGCEKIVIINDCLGQSSDPLISCLLNDSAFIVEEEKYCNYKSVISSISRCDLVFTSKLHVGVVACSFERPVISIYVHPKIPRFYRSIGLEDISICYKDNWAKKVPVAFNTSFVRGQGYIATIRSCIDRAATSLDYFIDRLK